MKRLFVGSALIIIVFLILSISPRMAGNGNHTEQTPRVEFLTENGPVRVYVEIADTPETRQQGLMFRESLEPDEGMLFIFDSEAEQVFWMKNTIIPLDMIFVNGSMEVVSIQEAVPCREDPCTLYPSGKPAKYVVETNYGFSETNGIEEGTKVRIVY